MHMAQLLPLPLTVSCSSKIQIGFTFLVPAHPGSPGQRAVKCVCVYSTGDRFMADKKMYKFYTQNFFGNLTLKELSVNRPMLAKVMIRNQELVFYSRHRRVEQWTDVSRASVRSRVCRLASPSRRSSHSELPRFAMMSATSCQCQPHKEVIYSMLERA